jgi:putative MFS transporter
MAHGVAAADMTAGMGWVSRALNGGGEWRLRGKAPWLLGLLMLFDSWDSVVIAYALPSIIAEWRLSALEGGWLISAGYGGQFLGAILFGAVAEKHGRLPVLRSLVVIMSLLAVACAFAGSYGQLIALRLVQGLAIGGALPVAVGYINEIAPTATRGRFFGTFQFLMTSGFGLAALASAWIVPAYGWRPMFAIGFVPLALLPFSASLPESPRWLAARGRIEDAVRALARLGCGPGQAQPSAQDVAAPAEERIPFARLFASGTRGKSIVAGLLWFLTSLVSFGLVTWIPSIYVTMFGIPVADALRYNMIVAFAVFVLPVILRQTIDRVGRRPPVILGTALGGLALLAMCFTSAGSVGLIVGLAIVGQIGISVGSMILWPYTAEIFDTRIRSLALGSASSMARGASMLTPLVVGGVMQATGSVTWVFAIFGTASLIVATLWLFATRETAGREIDA